MSRSRPPKRRIENRRECSWCQGNLHHKHERAAEPWREEEEDMDPFKQLDAMLAKRLEENKEHCDAMHKRMMQAAAADGCAFTNLDILLHIMTLVHELNTQEGPGRIETGMIIGLLALKSGAEYGIVAANPDEVQH